MNYVQEAFPIVEKQILEVLTTEDQKDIALRAFSNCMRFILKQISRKETLQLWQKLHSLFALKLDVSDQGQATVEPVNVTDIQEMLFKVDTYYLTEASAVEYAMCKLETAKKETMETFDKLLVDARKISNTE